MIRRSSCSAGLFAVLTLAAPVQADDAQEDAAPGRNGEHRAHDGSRALPITLIALGVPAVVGGVIGIALDQDPGPKEGPTILDTGRPGAIAVVTGAAFTAVGTYLYLRQAPATPVTSRAWMKWSGVALVGAAVIGTGIGIKLDLDRRGDDDKLYELCQTACTGSEYTALLDHRGSLMRGSEITLDASALVAMAGVAVFLLSRERSEGEPRIEISSTKTSIGWATSF